MTDTERIDYLIRENAILSTRLENRTPIDNAALVQTKRCIETARRIAIAMSQREGQIGDDAHGIALLLSEAIGWMGDVSEPDALASEASARFAMTIYERATNRPLLPENMTV